MVNLEIIARYKADNLFLRAKTNSGEEVVIKPATLEDINRLYGFHEDLKYYRRKAESHRKTERSMMFILESKKGPFGRVTLKNIRDEGNAEYDGVTRVVDSHTKGGMTVALKEINRFGFEEVGIEKFFLTVDSFNYKARKLYYNCGFISISADIPMELTEIKEKGQCWVSNLNLGGKAKRYLTEMELTKERFEFLKSLS